MPKACASLSLDLDNKWSYMKTHGDEGWDKYPSYLDVVVPRVLNILDDRNLKITFFVVGQDAAIESNHAVLRSISTAGHEIGNHSYQHEPWLHLYSENQLNEEFDQAEQHIFAATNVHPEGFRGPGFSCSQQVLQQLAKRGYTYDCSTFPTFLGPIARAYYFMTAKLSDEERQERKQLFGTLSEGFRTLQPHRLATEHGDLVEIPVTTMPLFKVPIHLSYVLYLGQFSTLAATAYFRFALLMCRLFRVEPSILLHPLDFLGADDDADLAFFPAMGMKKDRKLELATNMIDMLCNQFDVVTMREHARRVRPQLSLAPKTVPGLS